MYRLVQIQHRWHPAAVLVILSGSLFFGLSKAGDQFTSHELKIAATEVASDIQAARLTLAQSGKVSSGYISSEMRAILIDLTRTTRKIQLARPEPSLKPSLIKLDRIANRAAELLRGAQSTTAANRGLMRVLAS